MIIMFKDIKDYENYQISDTGIVINKKTGRELKQQEKKGYMNVSLFKDGKKKNKLVHRLVAEAFIENIKQYPQVNHKDEDSLNNMVNNLEWCTAKYNSNYGTHKEKLKRRMLENNPFKGKHHTDESKEKMRIAKIGKESKRKRKIIINGKEYDSVTKAMKELKVGTKKIYQLLKEENK
jgi:hypothetical protein